MPHPLCGYGVPINTILANGDSFHQTIHNKLIPFEVLANKTISKLKSGLIVFLFIYSFTTEFFLQRASTVEN